jgi:hypothetical protein
VVPAIQAEVVRDLEHVLVEQVVDRERLVAQRRVGSPALADLDVGNTAAGAEIAELL